MVQTFGPDAFNQFARCPHCGKWTVLEYLGTVEQHVETINHPYRCRNCGQPTTTFELMRQER